MKKFYLLLGVCLLLLPLGAQELRVTALRSPRQVKFAEPFDMSLTAVYPQAYTVAVNKEESSPDFEITDIRLTPNDSGGNLSLSVRPYALNISTFTVVLNLMKDNQSVLEREVPVPLTVEPVKLFKDDALREIRDPRTPISLLAILLILLAAAAIVAAIYFFTRKKKEEQGPRLTVPADTRPCHVIALAQINALIDSGLWEKKQYKLFYISLSDIWREYIWRRFQIDASADTSAELLKRAKKTNGLSVLVPQMRKFLASGDLVKFAKVVPSERERNADVILLQDMIKQTVPPPPAENKEATK